MMIARPLTPAAGNPPRGHSESPMQPLKYLEPTGVKQRSMIRTSPFAFRPRPLPPVNLVKGSPRLYG